MKGGVIDVDEGILDDLKKRLDRTRWAQTPSKLSGWDYGVDQGVLADMVDYWQDRYNWREQEAVLNSMGQHFKREVDIGVEHPKRVTLHYIVRKCDARDHAPALLLCHGWPGSFLEFYKVVEKLGHCFDLVIPSIPGYAFSEAPRHPGFSVVDVARSYHVLMTVSLGHSTYFAQGGDWGSIIVRSLAIFYPEHCVAIHVNMPVALPTAGYDYSKGSPADRLRLQRMNRFRKEGMGYQMVHKTIPNTLGAALSDSPVGLLAWIMQMFYAWSDDFNVFTKDEILTNVMIYWVSNSITSSMRLYRESFGDKEMASLASRRVTVPTGIAIFPKEVYAPPREWIEAAYNVQRFSTFDKGGHFAALEQPELFASDVLQFFNSVLIKSKL